MTVILIKEGLKSSKRSSHLTITLPEPSDDRFVFLNTLPSLIKTLYQKNSYYSKAGALLSLVFPKENAQTSLSPLQQTSYKPELLNVIDSIRQRHGFKSLTSAQCLYRSNWAPRCFLKSQRYTTCWTELLCVK